MVTRSLASRWLRHHIDKQGVAITMFTQPPMNTIQAYMVCWKWSDSVME